MMQGCDMMRLWVARRQRRNEYWSITTGTVMTANSAIIQSYGKWWRRLKWLLLFIIRLKKQLFSLNVFNSVNIKYTEWFIYWTTLIILIYINIFKNIYYCDQFLPFLLFWMKHSFIISFFWSRIFAEYFNT